MSVGYPPGEPGHTVGPMSNDAPPHLLITLQDMCELFPSYARDSIYRWNSSGRKKMLPEPAMRVARTPLWTEQQVREYADGRGIAVDEAAMRRLHARAIGVGS